MQNEDETKKLIITPEPKYTEYGGTDKSLEKSIEKSTEKSLVITQNTTQFDLYKGFIYMAISCTLKSLFAIFCKLLLARNASFTSFHLNTFLAYITMIISIIVGLFVYFFSIRGGAVKNQPIAIGKSNTDNSEYRRNSNETTLNNNNNTTPFISKRNLNLYILRSALSVASMSLVLFALKNASISEVYSVYYLYPGIVILLSFILLREKVSSFDIICLFFCFIGVLLVIRPDSIFPNETKAQKTSIYIFGFVLLGAVLKGIEDVIIRNVGHEVNCLLVPAIFSITGMILFPIPLVLSVDSSRIRPDMDYIDILLMISISVCSFSFQVFLALAIQNENAGRVSMVNYLQVFFMFMSDILIFHKHVVLYDFIGTFLISGFNVANGLRKVIMRNSELEKMRRKAKESDNEKGMKV